MTAEVAVANKSAVALAADSKVTVGRGSTQKTYDTVNKLFTLSKFDPVGVMIYGNSEFMEFPWETVIKMYRNDVLKDKSFDSVHKYADNFFKYISNDLDIKKNDWSKIVFQIVLDKLIKISVGDDGEDRCDKEINRLERETTILRGKQKKIPQCCAHMADLSMKQ